MNENFRGICCRCGIAHSDPNHACTDDQIRLMEIDRESLRALREEMIASGRKGFGDKLQTLEDEASAIRNKNK